MQYPEYEIEIFYAETIQTILFTCFYSALLPAGIICSLISLTLLYFMHKVNILFFFKKKNIKKEKITKAKIRYKNDWWRIISLSNRFIRAFDNFDSCWKKFF